MKKDRDIVKMASRGLKRSTSEAVVQYGRGLQEGMRLAYLSVVRRFLRVGQSERDIRVFMGGLMKQNEIDDLLREAKEA